MASSVCISVLSPAKMCTLFRYAFCVTIYIAILNNFVTVVEAKSKQKKSVSIVLDAKWKSTPLLLETSEFLAEEDHALFWNFVERICDKNENIAQKSDQEIYDIMLTEAEKLLTPSKISLLKFYLSLRAYSPMVEMFQQVALNKQLPNCEAIVEINGETTCDPSDIEMLLKNSTERNKEVFHKVDHHYSLSFAPIPTSAILYGELGTLSFSKMHHRLKKFASNDQVDYAVRHYVKSRSKKKVRLSGYGVELAIKSTEYKAQDDTKVKSDGENEVDDDDEGDIDGFLFSTLIKKHPELDSNLEEFKQYLMENSAEMVPLKKWEMQSISLQAAQKIVSSSGENSLTLLGDIAQNFPIQAKSLVGIKVKDLLKKEIEKNQELFMNYHDVQPGGSALYINGIHYDIDVIDIFSLIEDLRDEVRKMDGLHSIGLKDDTITNLMKLDLKPKQEWAVDIRDSAVMYLNDIENDSKYQHWPSSLNNLLHMFHYGMLSKIRRNIFHMVIIADPSKKENRFLYKMAESFYVHGAPVRIGLVFAVNPDMEVNGHNDPGVAMLNAFNFISMDKSAYHGLSFITDVYLNTESKNINADDVIAQFKKNYKDEDLELIFGSDSDYDTGRKLAWNFVNKTGLDEQPKVIINGVPLDQKKVTESEFEESALMEVIVQQQKIAEAVHLQQLNDQNDVLDWLMNKGHVLPRLNRKILSTKDAVFLDLSSHPAELSSIDSFQKLPNPNVTASIVSNIKYLTMKDNDVYRMNTVLVVTDMETDGGRNLLDTAVDHMHSSNSVRLGVIHNPKDESALKITKIMLAAFEALDRKQLKTFVPKLLKKSNYDKLIGNKMEIKELLTGQDIDMEKLNSAFKSTENLHNFHLHFCNKVLGLKPGQMAIVADGKVIGPFDRGDDLKLEDLDLLEKYSKQVYADDISVHVKKLDLPPEQQSDVASKVSSLLMSQPTVKSRVDLRYKSDEYSVLKIEEQDKSKTAVDIQVIVDPISRSAQKIAPLLSVLKEVVNAKIKIFMNSKDKLSDLPLKSIYRYVLEPEPLFSPEDGSILGPGARFTRMPTTPLFTLAMITPENWMVEAVKSVYDLDNIHLQDVANVVYAEFELEHLLLEGHCFEQATGNPPRGLQFNLGTVQDPVKFDTIVMANLGYFQLKASVGAWMLKLRHGRSSELYEIASHENTDSVPNSEEVQVIINSFKSKVVKIRVSKTPGNENKELLEDEEDEEESGIWNSITSSFSSNKQTSNGEDIINIFSLASGHLYERFLRIMMLSVLKNTKTPVKFWFLKNFLSPTFKDFLPEMAKKYGFEYELVQYKWPRWLHQQTEKQRVIWGYKILFLDVLFPLDVKKIIFVDADQVVRADMKELVNLNLQGAPYGYTPFCNSRTDMDGYRFWKSGYWSSHLGPRRYHISALYVVDLKKFRQVAAGDRLRGQYHGLSQDPNSLSNLDQDLPNNMIHQVKIKSLPQDWLWCETWCDDASKSTAKTIDLCNNPKTKEPKLASAMRIIPEWNDYDKEIKNLQDSVANNKSIIKEESSEDKSKSLPRTEL